MDAKTHSIHYSTWLKWISLAVILICLFVLLRVLPIDQAVEGLKQWIGGLGFWAPLVYGLIYAVAAVLLVPGTILTLTAGAIFGLMGVVVVLPSATLGASLAFLIGRYAARGSVEKMAQNSDKFAAVDKAVGEGGWKIVAMLRLSPAVPFTYQNYLLGLTPIRFWPYALTTFIAMAPGTAMYVYLGAVGGAAASGGLSAGQWVLLGVGLAVTIALTVYLTILAKKKLAEQTRITQDQDQADADSDPQASDSRESKKESEQDMRKGWTPGAIVSVVAALVLVIATGCAIFKKQEISSLFGPPQVELKEAYAVKPDGPTFDHSVFDALLAKHVNSAGGVDYSGMRADEDQLNRYLDQLAKAPFDQMGRNQKLALLINAYNAFTIRLILDHAPVKSIQDIPADQRWNADRWHIGGHTWSLDQIENEQLRPKFVEPRMHWALVCAAVSCPPLRTEAYTADRINDQLQSQAQTIFHNDKWFSYDRKQNLIHISPISKWYRGDFKQASGSLLKYIASYSPQVKTAMDQGKKPRIMFKKYDWKLNSQKNIPAPHVNGGQSGGKSGGGKG